ncbi:hypothetical protein MRBLMI12_001020 [Microbacterium sp. LMI12-1-1.1]
MDQSTWIIRDAHVPTTDARSVVACVSEAAWDGVDVLWLHPVGLPTHYRTADAVLRDLIRHGRRSSGTTRPIPIPHRPPVKPERC